MISLGHWSLFALLDALFWLWVLRWGGAERLEGTFASGFLVSWFAPKWSAEGIKLFALLSLVGTLLAFAVGLFVPEIRCWYAC
jgi:hypothetical protein